MEPKGRHSRGTMWEILVAHWNQRADTREAPCEKSWWHSEIKGQAHVRQHTENHGGAVKPKGRHARGTVRKIVVPSETKGQAHARHRAENRGGTVEPKCRHTRGTVRKIVVAQWNLRAGTG